jgi:hypothetical protein
MRCAEIVHGGDLQGRTEVHGEGVEAEAELRTENQEKALGGNEKFLSSVLARKDLLVNVVAGRLNCRREELARSPLCSGSAGPLNWYCIGGRYVWRVSWTLMAAVHLPSRDKSVCPS